MERNLSDGDVPTSKLLLVDFRCGEAVTQHPDLVHWLEQGWKVHSASPRLTENGTRLLVVLHAPARTTRRPVISLEESLPSASRIPLSRTKPYAVGKKHPHGAL